MSKKYGKIAKISLLMLILFVVISAFNIVKAEEDLLTKMETQAKNFLSEGSNQSNISTTNIAKEFSGLGQILTMIGAGVMVAVTTYMGIKYFISSPEEQAKLKQQTIGLVVAAVVIEDIHDFLICNSDTQLLCLFLGYCQLCEHAPSLFFDVCKLSLCE